MLVCFNGLVVREAKSDDYGKFITVITDSCGRVFMSAKGVNSIKNRNSAGCGMFTYGEFIAYYRNGYYTLKSAVPSRMCIKSDGTLQQFALASYFAELADIFSRGEQDTSDILHYCINALHIIYKGDRPLRLIKAIYELRMLCAAGYMPDTEVCAGCGKPLNEDVPLKFCYIDGVFVCPDCQTEPQIKYKTITPGCFKLMRYVIGSPENKAYAVKVPERTMNEFYEICQDFLLSQIENMPETLEFYSKIEEDNGEF